MEHPQGRDYAWAGVALVMLILLSLGLIAIVLVVVLDGAWSALLSLPIGALFYWWIGMGAWRRTVWGRRAAQGRSGTGSRD